jgi:phage terminase large subunit
MTTHRQLDRFAEQIGDLEERRGGSVSWEELRAYRDRGVEFCREVLDLELTPQQREAWEAIDREEATQALIMGGNGLGKDTLGAARGIYEAVVLDALVLLTGPSDRQVREILMRREVARLLRRTRGKIAYERFAMAVRFPGLEHGYILAFTASDPDKGTGHHAPRVSVVMTECQGIAQELWQAFQKCRVGLGLTLAFGNPNKAAGAAYAASRSGTWLTRFWSAFDHPNLIEGREVIPGGPTVAWVQQMKREYGEGSPFYQSAVLGQFPTEGSVDSLVRLEQVEAAFARHDRGVVARWDQQVVLALDVARSHAQDENVCAAVQGSRVLWIRSWHSRDLIETTQKFLGFKNLFATSWSGGTRTVRLVADASGVGGGVIDSAKEKGHNVREYWGWNPSQNPRFANLRAEHYWHLRKLLESGEAVLPRDEKLQEDLLAMEWGLDAKGRILMLSKDDLRKSLGRSPDRADAVVMGIQPARTARTFAWSV